MVEVALSIIVGHIVPLFWGSDSRLATEVRLSLFKFTKLRLPSLLYAI